MSIQSTLVATLFSFLIVSLLACGTGGGTSSSNKTSRNPPGDSRVRLDSNPQNPLIGTWVCKEYRLIFNPDNTYIRDFNQEGIPAVQGSVSVSGNVLIVTDSGSCMSSAAEKNTSGSYTYILSGNTLTFSLFHDSCNDRAAFFELTYAKQ